MALITTNLKFYIPEINDPNYVYVKGFADNFNALDEKLDGLLSTALATTTSTDATTKKAVSDFMTHKWEGHILSKTDDTSATANETTYGSYYGVNPHNITPAQLYIPTSERTGTTGRVTSADGIVHDINTRLTLEGTGVARHRIKWKFVNTQEGKLSEIGSGIADRPHSDLSYLTLDTSSTNTAKDKHLSNAQSKKWEDHVNTTAKATDNPHNVSAQNLKSSDTSDTGGKAIQRAINNQGNDAGINWIKVNKATSNLTDIVTRNHDDLQNKGTVDHTSRDTTENKHISNLDVNELHGHLKSNAAQAGVKTIDGTGTGVTNYPTAQINPHKVRAGDLWSSNTATHKHGADTIINEINTNGTSEGITTANTKDKIYWNLIDKENIDGLGNDANINTIPLRSHQDLQNILPAVVTSTNTTLNRHVSDAQTKKWEDHVNTTAKATVNPHNVSAQNLKSSTSTNTGGIAIAEAINSQASNNALNWNKVNKATSNLTDIVTRNHSSLQSIGVLDPASTNATKDKHLSNAQAKVWEDHKNTTAKATANPHNVSAQNLKSSDNTMVGGQAIQRAVNIQGLDGGINWTKVAKTGSNLTEITTRNHSDLQNIGEVSTVDSNATKDKHVSNLLARKWDVHADYIAGGNPHRTTAYNLYTGAGEKKGGKAIAEAINNQADTSSIDWVKINKTGSNLTDMVTRNHSDLQNILGVVSSTDGTKNKHISNAQFKTLEDHRNSTSNPHTVTATQIGANPMIDVINSGTTTSKVNRDRLNLTGFNITEIANRNHDDLNAKGILDTASTDATKNKHLSNAQGKKWEDHVNKTDGTNPHSVEAKNIGIDTISGITATNIQKALEDIALKTSYNSAGPILNTATITTNATGVLVQACDFSMYHTSDFTAKLYKHTVPQKQFATADFTDNRLTYIYAEYAISGGTLSYKTTLDISTVNWSNQVFYGWVFRTGTTLEVGKAQDFGNGTSEKLVRKDVYFNRFEVESGLHLIDDSDKAANGTTPINAHFRVTAGSVWMGLERLSLTALNTRTTNLTWYKTKTDGTWETQSVSAPIVWKVDSGTGVNDATEDYVANWIYRDVKKSAWYIVLGTTAYDREETVNFTLGYADAQPPNKLPDIIKDKCVLVGKVITKKNETINTAVYKTQGILFTNTSTGFTPITSHNTLTGIQGGEANNYQHLTSAQVSKLNAIEAGADVTDVTNVGNKITDIIANNGNAGVTINSIYTMAKKGANDMVKKAGDRMTGTLSIQKNGLAFAIGADASGDYLGGNDAWFRMGNQNYAFNHVYKGSESGNSNAYELWTTNNASSPNTTDAYNINPSGRVWRVTQDGVFNIYKNIISTANIKMGSLTNTGAADITGQTKIKKGSTDWKDTVIKANCSMELGQDGGGYSGSLKLWSSEATRYSIIRMHQRNLFFDTAGKYYFNWDKTDTNGELLLGDGGDFATPETTRTNYVHLKSNDKSYFKNGLQIGTTSNTSGYAADFGANIHMHNKNVDFLNQIHFNSGIRFQGKSNSTTALKADHTSLANIDFYTGGYTGVFKGRVRVDGDNFGMQNLQGEWFIANAGDDTVIHRDGVVRIRATATGATIHDDLQVDGQIKEGGTVLASKYLGLTAKAADSELLDGVDSSRFIYGQNGHGSNRHNGDMNLIYKSGFFFGNPSSNQPTGSAYGYTIHCQYSENSKGGFQIYSTDNSSSFYMRSKSANSDSAWRSWVTLYTTANKPTKTDVGLGNLPNSKSDAINLNDSNVLATAKAVKTAYDKASAASDKATNADNAQKLDNLDSTQFLRSDTDDTATGILTINNDMRVRNMMFMSSNSWTHAQRGNIVYNHSDTETANVISGVSDVSKGHFKIGHSETGVGTDVDVESILVHTGNVYVKDIYARENINFIRSGAKKASIEYNSTTNSLDFVF